MFINTQTREIVEEVPFDAIGFLPLINITIPRDDARYYEDRGVNTYTVETAEAVTVWSKEPHSFVPELTQYITSNDIETPPISTEEFTQADWVAHGFKVAFQDDPVDKSGYAINGYPIYTDHGDYLTWTHYELIAPGIIRAEKELEINRERDILLAGGFDSLGHTFDSDDSTLLSISALFMMANINPDFTTPFITRDNQTIQLSNDDIKTLGGDALAFKAGVIFAARAKKDAIL